MYDHDRDDIDVLGWDEFVLRVWESIFTGYRSGAGLRTICRRWSDLIEAGLGCSQELADLLVRAELIDRADRDLEGAVKPAELLAGMADVLAEIRFDLQELAEIRSDLEVPAEIQFDLQKLPEIRADELGRLLEQHDRLRVLVLGLSEPDGSGQSEQDGSQALR